MCIIKYNTIQYKTIQYNTTLVKQSEVPKTWMDLLDAKWRGRLLLNDPRNSANYTGWADAVATQHGIDYLTKLSGQNLKIVSSGAAGAQQTAAGASDVSFPTVTSFSTGLQAQGAPIAFQDRKSVV